MTASNETLIARLETDRATAQHLCGPFADLLPTDEIAVHALHPGVIASDIWRRIPWPIRPIITRRMRSTDEGAQTSLWCATSDDLAGASGGYYADCAAKAPSEVATPELASWLWARSEDWTAG